MTALDLSQAPSLHRPELWAPDAPELWRPSREIVRAAGGYRPGPVQRRRAAASAPPAYDLLSANPALFLRSSAGDVYQSDAGTPPGTTPITALTQPVGAWRDVGSSGGHATQTSASARRGTVAALNPFRLALNGSQSYSLASSNIAVPGASVFIAKFALASTATAYRALCQINGSGAGVGMYVTSGGGGYKQISARMGNAVGTAGTIGFDWTLDTAMHTLCIEYDGVSSTGGGSYVMRWDGVVQTLSASGSKGASTSQIGSEFAGGMHYFGFDGLIAGIFYLPRPFADATERTNVLGAFASL